MMKTAIRIIAKHRELVLAPLLLVFSTREMVAQGLPVDMGSDIPFAILFAGTAVFGLVLAYGILRTRNRTRSEKRLTEQATKDLYAREERDAEL